MLNGMWDDLFLLRTEHTLKAWGRISDYFQCGQSLMAYRRGMPVRDPNGCSPLLPWVQREASCGNISAHSEISCGSVGGC
jgi:hypothetical protein